MKLINNRRRLPGRGPLLSTPRPMVRRRHDGEPDGEAWSVWVMERTTQVALNVW